ncbi:MAG: FtsX-like permease family protein [Flavobacteriaceae bacterium]
MKVPFYIAKRYVFSRSKSSAINFITGITAIGIFVGALVMFVILSVFSGLREYSFQFINGFDPDLKLVTTVGKTLDFTSEKEQKLRKIEGIEQYSKFLEERILLRYDSKEQIAYAKGVDENFEKVNPVEDFVYMGEWLPEANQAVVGYIIAQKLSIGIFDHENVLQILVPKTGKGSLSQDDFSKISVRPLGIYSFNDEDIDSRYVYISLPLAQHLLQLDADKISGIEFKLKQGVSESKIKSELIEIFGKDISIKNRMELNDTLHKMHNTENLIVYLIITLVIIITLFTLIGTIIMMIWDKKQNLKTLYSLGLQIKDLRNIFLFQGLLLSFFGCIPGLILGIVIVLLQQQFGFWMISSTLAYPIKFTFQNIAIVALTIMILGFLASKIASDRVSERLL